MSAKGLTKKPVPEKQIEFSAAFERLRAVLAPYAGKNMRVVHDDPGHYYLETRFPVFGRGPVMFAAVRKGKNYVSYHLMPLYMNEPLQARISPELMRRKQGKACFNFAKPDEKLFAEIAKLTKLGLESFKKLGSSSTL